MQTNLTAAWIARFWSKIGRGTSDQCWPWRGTTDRRRYGRPRDPRTGRLVRAHRIVWELTYGALPTEQVVRHRCDQPACCNPSHLQIGTQLDNIADRNARGRTARGERASHAKLTDAMVRDIRRRSEAGERGVRLAREYGVRNDTIYSVLARRTWVHLD